MGATSGKSTSSPPVVENVVPVEEQDQAATVDNLPQPFTEEVQGPPLVAAMAIEQLEEKEQGPPVEAGAASEPGFVDITSLLGAPTVIVVRSTL